MSRRHLSELELIGYADGEMPQARLEPAEEHLRQCDFCASTLAASRQMSATLGRMHAVAAPGDLRKRILTELAPDLEQSLTCRQALPLLQELLDRCLSPLMHVRLRKHLTACAGCREQYASLVAATRLVRSLEPVAAPAAVRERVAAAERPVRRIATGPSLRPVWAIAAVAATTALALLVHPGFQVSPTDPAAVVTNRPAGQNGSASVTKSAPIASAPAVVAEAQRGSTAAAEVTGGSANAVEPAVRLARNLLPKPRTVATARTQAGTVRRPVQSAQPTVIAAAPLPAAIRALKQVARSAEEYDLAAQRGMDLAAEPFATLHPEEKLNEMPDFATFKATDAAAGRPASAPVIPGSASGEEPGRNAASAPDALGSFAPGPLA